MELCVVTNHAIVVRPLVLLAILPYKPSFKTAYLETCSVSIVAASVAVALCRSQAPYSKFGL